MQQFTHLHNHTDYSMLDGISKIPELVAKAKELGMDSLAITDHGTMYGAVEFYSECKDQDIKPIIGCEVYVAQNSRHTKDRAEGKPHHLVLLAKNRAGYQNLMKMVTLSNTEGFYHTPRVDKELLQRHHEGLICLSGCASAELPGLLAQGKKQEAERTAAWYREVFGEDYYLELQRHEHVPGLALINEGLIGLRSAHGYQTVITNDAHYITKDQAPLQDIYICIQTNATTQDEKRLRMEDPSYYLKSPQEMLDLFQDLPPQVLAEAAGNTVKIAAGCDLSLDFGVTHLPKFQTPGGMDADEYLLQLCTKGFREKYPNPSREASERLEYEMEVIRQTRFANYFLVVWDIIRFVRERNILFGVRGSAAASVVLHCLGITDVEPLEYKLVFERFLNFERKEMPDIDMDFQDDRREEILNYVIEKYGSDRVAQIITFQTMGAKASLKDVGRALGLKYGDVDRITKMVPPKARTLEDAKRLNPQLQEAYDTEEVTRDLFDKAKALEGTVNHVGTHAAGVLIAENPLTETVPLQRPVKGEENTPVLMTQYSMDPVAKLGLLKMDFLGLTNLTILNRAIALIREETGQDTTLKDIPLTDQQTFRLLSSGNTKDVFQLESTGMQRYVKELKPSNLNDIAAMIALYRPGPMENIERFIDGKHGRITISYPHESFKELLDETYGVIVYQDQVLFILQQFAGYSLGAADIVRKAMGKKIPSLMAKERENFLKGTASQGYDNDVATEIFDLIEPFAGYAFNKAHSVSYALISYWTAYFKTHHPVEYMAAALNSRLGDQNRRTASMNESWRLGIPILPPDINRSHAGFTIDADLQGRPALRTGLAAIKLVGNAAVEPLVADRNENGDYRSMEEFSRSNGASGLNKRTLEVMTRAGTFDNLAPRGAILASIEAIAAEIQRASKTRAMGQASLFGDTPETATPGSPRFDLSQPDATKTEKAAWEKEFLGMALSYNPVLSLSQYDDGNVRVTVTDIVEEMEGQQTQIMGIVNHVGERSRRDGEPFYIVALEMLGGSIDVTVWPEVLKRTKSVWKQGNALRISGKVRTHNDSIGVTCEEAALVQLAADDEEEEEPILQDATTRKTAATDPDADGLNTTPEPAARLQPKNRGASGKSVNLKIQETADPQADIAKLRETVSTLLEFPGTDAVTLTVITGQNQVFMEFPVVSTEYSEKLRTQLEEILGPGAVTPSESEPQQPGPEHHLATAAD